MGRPGSLLVQIAASIVLWKVCSAEGEVAITLPEEAVATLGDGVTLQAAFDTSFRLISVTWSKLHGNVTSQKRTSVLSYVPDLNINRAYGSYKERARLLGMASLRIDPTTTEDEGTYALSIMTDERGTVEKFIHLSLQVAPRVVVGPRNPYVTVVGESVSLACKVTDAKPNITSLYWEKDGARLEASSFLGKYSGGDARTPSLTIRHVMRMDAGVYTCVAQNSVRSGEGHIGLRVHYYASITSISEPVEVTVGDHVTFRCVAEGSPTPNITWSRNGLKLKASSDEAVGDVRTSALVLSSVELTDTGTYSCTARNGIGGPRTRNTHVDVIALDGGFTSTTVAIISGAAAGGLWLLICLCLLVYLLRKRRRGGDRKKFTYYYSDVQRRSNVATSEGGGSEHRRQVFLTERKSSNVAFEQSRQENGELVI
ncbi:protein amalgam-like [Branchiostoma lanceolatum]|uniref:protein amalgam-like n=1 Tax=Branchiostoma lanceolatum TaxID=7740 RepID=UPI00345139D1